MIPAAWLAVLGAMAAWLHFTGVIAASMAFLYATVLILARGAFDWRVVRRIGAAAVLCAVLMLPVPVLAWTVIAAEGADGAHWIRANGLAFAIHSMLRVLLLAPWSVDPWPVLGPACAGIAALIWLLLVWLTVRAGHRTSDRAAVVATLFGGIVLFLLVQAFQPLVLPRTLQVLAPLVAVLLGFGLASVRPRAVRVFVFTVFLVSQTPSFNDIFNAPPDGSDWRGLSARMADEVGPGSGVIALDVFDAVALVRYRAPGAPIAEFLLLPPSGAAMQRFVAGRLLSIPAIGPRDIVAALCDADMPMNLLIVVERLSPVLEQVRGTLQTSLTGSGALPGDASGDRSLRLRSWTAPTCPPRPAATRS
jgi:hypothetical protein